MKHLVHDRVHLLGYILLAILAVFILRLFYLQVIQHEYYSQLADREQVKRLVIPAKRGLIYAMDGNTPVKLVLNQQVYKVIADPQVVNDIDKVIQTVNSVAGGTAVEGMYDLLKNDKSRYAVLATNLSDTQAKMIKDAELAGVGLQNVSQRVYPEGALAAQTLGFVNTDGEGQYGVEGALDDELAGEDGVMRSVTDISNVPLTLGRDNIRKEPVHGKDVVLSIDRNIQAYAKEALRRGMREVGAQNGSVLVMNPNNGQVMATLSLPDYDPTNYSKVKNGARFVNGPTMIPYEPASVMKTFILAAGLDKGAITPSSTYVNTGSIEIEDRQVRNFYEGYRGTRTMQEVMDHSLNTGTITIAQRLGDGRQITKQARETMYHYYHDRFGIGKNTGIEIAGEAPGIIYSPEDVQGNAVRYSNMTFGQGLNATMLQVSAGYCSLVNGGTYYAPTIVAGHMNSDTLEASSPKVVQNPVSARTAGQVRTMLHGVRQKAYAATQDRPGYYIGGKTGTAQVLKPDGTYSDDESVGSYVGFGGTKKRTEYVIMIQMSAPGKDIMGALTVPIFTDISNWLLQYLRVQPED